MQVSLLRYKFIDYPSGSALEYHKEISYLIGDDVNHILCLDNDWNEINQLKLFDFDGDRIPKPDKPDLECATIMDNMLYVIGSGSRSPQRDVAFLINLSDYKIKKISTAAFYSIFRDRNLITEMNIEGFTDCRDKLLFFNRGNTSQPNQIIITDQRILKKQFPDKFKVMPIVIGSLNKIALGISGACYNAESDILLLTASAEDTDNAYDDGKIIGSAIGVVYNAYQKLNENELVINELIHLDTIDPVFEKQKIESICITSKSENKYICTLVSDNDNGKSELFQVSVQL